MGKRLVDGAGDTDVLSDGNSCDGRKESVEFRGRCTVPLNLLIELVEREAGGEEERFGPGEGAAQVAREDQESFVVDPAGHVGLSLDVDHTFGAEIGAAHDADGTAECLVADLNQADAVNLTHLRSRGLEREDSPFDQVQDFGVGTVVSDMSSEKGPLNMVSLDYCHVLF